MPLPASVHALLRTYHIKPKKSLGQNFLVEEKILTRIVERSGVTPHTHVVEIGAGIGNLTYYLATNASHVTAIEIDRNMIPALEHVLKGIKNTTIIQGDILSMHIPSLVGDDPYMVIANIPYYITSAIIRHVLESPNLPTGVFLTIQQAVAQRICATDGNLSLLALSVHIFGEPSIVLHIPAGAFFPAPNVDSALLAINLYPQPRVPSALIDPLFCLAKHAFQQKRKMLRNSLAKVPGLEENTASLLESAAIDPTRRAQTLRVEDWCRLAQEYQKRIK